jgi:trimethylamine--corrinoid protein Co-methyltransferase
MSLRPRFGTPEARIIEMAGCQMARYYGLLCRGNVGLTDATAYDFQSGAQAMMSPLSVLQGGPNFLTGAGLLGSYMGASVGKILLDAELVIMAKRFLSPIKVDEEALAVRVIDDIGPGGHYIEHSHTLDNYRSEFLTESLFRSPDYEKWKAMGKRVVVQLAQEKAQEIIESYEKPPIDPGLEEEVDAYVKRRWYES